METPSQEEIQEILNESFTLEKEVKEVITLPYMTPQRNRRSSLDATSTRVQMMPKYNRRVSMVAPTTSLRPTVMRRNTRSLSLTGQSAEEGDKTLYQPGPDDPCLPSGSKSFARIRSVGRSNSTVTEKTASDTACSHFTTTFQNSIMFISKRIDVLEKLYAKEETERVPGEEEMKSLQKIVETLSLCAVNLSTVIKGFNRRSKLATTGLIPDNVEEALSQSRFLLSKFTPYYSEIVFNLRVVKTKGIALELMIDANLLTSADGMLSDTVQHLDDVCNFLRKR